MTLGDADGVISGEVVDDVLLACGACGHCDIIISSGQPLKVRAALTGHLVAEHGIRRMRVRLIDLDVAEIVTVALPPAGRVL